MWPFERLLRRLTLARRPGARAAGIERAGNVEVVACGDLARLTLCTAKCKTVVLGVSLGNYAQWLPATKQIRTRGRYSGTVHLAVSPTERPSDTVIATAFGPKYIGRSDIAGVLIRR